MNHPTPPTSEGADADASDGSPAEAVTAGEQIPTQSAGRLERRFGRNGASVIEWASVIAAAVLIALVVKIFLFQAFYIPSPSMYPTLKEGDRVLVNKLSYKLHDVGRGDVIVFQRPASEDPSSIPDLIKRVIALPGESIAFEGGAVYIDGQRLDEPYLPTGVVSDADFTPYRCTIAEPCVIPPGDVWVMGDNRGDSKDSRYFGPIDQSSIVGRAFVKVWPFSRLGGL